MCATEDVSQSQVVREPGIDMLCYNANERLHSLKAITRSASCPLESAASRAALAVVLLGRSMAMPASMEQESSAAAMASYRVPSAWASRSGPHTMTMTGACLDATTTQGCKTVVEASIPRDLKATALTDGTAGDLRPIIP